MKKLPSLITVLVAVFATSLAKADPFTGFYKIAFVEEEVETYSDGSVFKETQGSSGRGKVFFNSAGKLRFKGWIEDWDEDDAGGFVRERTILFGVVNPTNGKIRLTKIGGERVSDLAVSEDFVIRLKIIKRNGVVVGLKGSGSAREVEFNEIEEQEYDITGYKTRDLPE